MKIMRRICRDRRSKKMSFTVVLIDNQGKYLFFNFESGKQMKNKLVKNKTQ
jgi:hypothetical protein